MSFYIVILDVSTAKFLSLSLLEEANHAVMSIMLLIYFIHFFYSVLYSCSLFSYTKYICGRFFYYNFHNAKWPARKKELEENEKLSVQASCVTEYVSNVFNQIINVFNPRYLCCTQCSCERCAALAERQFVFCLLMLLVCSCFSF